ncbi:hypothetical protein JQK88_20615 [Mesorhizobium caraganae]|uniref:hypothetical protein n=1 Tax=Mesorhizobium caraganae TaxID=483206 RepID=UPI001939B8BC|nr:hypothetical protein [Mesorhizobium caraganae]MBM2713572.1 hypothetical protein [Mesorhizobium caraganae]
MALGPISQLISFKRDDGAASHWAITPPSTAGLFASAPFGSKRHRLKDIWHLRNQYLNSCIEAELSGHPMPGGVLVAPDLKKENERTIVGNWEVQRSRKII